MLKILIIEFVVIKRKLDFLVLTEGQRRKTTKRKNRKIIKNAQEKIKIYRFNKNSMNFKLN